VGEFHYVHHAPGGIPYEDPNAIGRAVIEAAAACRAVSPASCSCPFPVRSLCPDRYLLVRPSARNRLSALPSHPIVIKVCATGVFDVLL